jgi:hypothetical protein
LEGRGNNLWSLDDERFMSEDAFSGGASSPDDRDQAKQVAEAADAALARLRYGIAGALDREAVKATLEEIESPQTAWTQWSPADDGPDPDANVHARGR